MNESFYPRLRTSLLTLGPLLLGAVSASAWAGTYQLDSFLVARNFDPVSFASNPEATLLNSPIFSDQFVSGSVPTNSTVPSGTGVYDPLGFKYSATGGNWTESGGSLMMDSALGTLASDAQGNSWLSEKAKVDTPINNPGLTNNGLISGVTFAALGVWHYQAPAAGEHFGIRLTDTTSTNPGDDVVHLFVQNDGQGGAQVQLDRESFVAGTRTVLGTAALSAPAGADEIILGLVHSNIANNDVYGGYQFWNSSTMQAVGGYMPLVDASNNPIAVPIFNGESYTRAGFQVAAAVPEASTWGLMLAGLGLVGWRARRHG